MTAEPGTLIVGRYEVVRSIGQGGMGEVFEATDRETKRRVAVKRLAVSGNDRMTGEAAARFRRELLATAQVTSRHVVAVHDGGVADDGVPFLVMDYLEGEDVGAIMDRLGVLPVELALRIAAHACEGLVAAHAIGVVHRDIKPSNLFLVAPTASGARIVKIVDFGIARVLRAGTSLTDGVTEMTRTGEIIGSPLYMAPEQLRGAKTLDHRADVWSLGVVLYRMLCGAVPHPRETLADLLITVCSEPAPALRERAPWVPAQVAALVHRALQIDPDARIASAKELGAEILACLPGDSSITDSMIVADAHAGAALPRSRALADSESSRVPPSPTAPPNVVAARTAKGVPIAPTTTTVPAKRPPAVTVAPGYAATSNRGSAIVLVLLLGVLAAVGWRAWREVKRSREVPQAEEGPPPDLMSGLPPKLAGTKGAAWFARVRGRCNATELRSVLADTPPPDDDDGLAFAAACAAIAGDLDLARATIAKTDNPAYASWPTFELAHPLADRYNGDPAIAAIMRLVLEFWPENYMATYHAGITEFIQRDPRARDHLRAFRRMYRKQDGFAATARAVLDELDHPGDPSCARVVVIDPEGHRIHPAGCAP